MTDACTVTLGFLGLGAIGLPIARHLLSAGRPMILFDPRSEALAPFEGRAEIAASPVEVANRADIIFACLPSADTYRTAVLGREGVIAGRRTRLYVHLGTTGTAHVRDLAAALQERGIETVDAPITGGVGRAVDGTLTSIVSGRPAAALRVEPLLRCYSTTVVNLGAEPGGAQMAKVVNNAVSLTNLVAACEAMVVGAKAGLDPAAMLAVLNSGSGQNSATLMKIPSDVLTGNFNFGGALRIVVKDLEAFLAEAAELGIETPTVACATEAYRRAIAVVSADGDVTEVVRPMEQAAGIELRFAPNSNNCSNPLASRTDMGYQFDLDRRLGAP
jgi:3-hydroxyisobutyrate dehydrogenase-like beta-hydroxyacid dehydrogenase